MDRLWHNDRVYRESCMFAGRSEARLLFDAAEILQVTDPVTGTVFEAGRDFTCLPGSGIICRTGNSRIPEVPANAIRPDEKTAILYPDPGANAIGKTVDGKLLIFSNESFFARNQVEVTYRAVSTPAVPVLDPQKNKLPRTRQLLARRGGEFRLTAIGDSITEGYNATAFNGIAPYRPCYVEQFRRELADRCGKNIILNNRAVGGSGIQHAAKLQDDWCNDRPDLLLIAYGMNNFNRMEETVFIDHIREITDVTRAANPETEFIIVTPMTGNPLWNNTRPGSDRKFAAAIREYVAQAPAHTACADVQTIWLNLLERKDFYDLTGNGVNHPNDYGHRVYASVLAELIFGNCF